MAKIWFARRGPEPTNSSDPHTELPLPDCVSKLGLRKAQRISPLEQTPKFDVQAKMASFTGPHFVVVEIDDAEAKKHQWQSGFYLLDISPQDARKILDAW